MKIYLAGAFAPYEFAGKKFSDWRDFVAQEVREEGKEIFDPRFKSNQLCPSTFTYDDAMGVLNCDCLLHYRMRGYEDEGASWEQGIAFAVNLLGNQGVRTERPSKLIVYVDECNAPFPLNFASANVNFSNLSTAVKFLRDISSTKKEDWISVYMGIMNRNREGK